MFPILFSISGCLLFESAQVDFPTGQAPIVEILQPIDDQYLYSYDKIQFMASIIDKDDNIEKLDITLHSSIDGAIDIANAERIADILETDIDLSAGTHTLTLSVMDTGGYLSIDQVDIQVSSDNTPPTCSFTAPEDGDVVSTGQEVHLIANAEDNESPQEDLIVRFESSIDGPLGETIPADDGHIDLPVILSHNAHQITMTVTDTGGDTCALTHTVYASNGPSVAITHPLDGAIINPNPVLFQGTISDLEDPPEFIEIEWESSIDGLLLVSTPDSTGETSFIAEELSSGNHSITLWATDSSGAKGYDRIDLVINIPPSIDQLEFLPETVTPSSIITCRAEASNPDGEPPTLSFVLQNQSTGSLYLPVSTQPNHVTLDLSQVNDVQHGDTLVCFATAMDEHNSVTTREVFATVITRNDNTDVSTSSQ